MLRIDSPGEIGPIRLRGRSVFPPMLMNFATDRGEVTQRLVEFYRRLAAGGFGLVMTECIFPQFKGGIATRGLALYDDRFLPGMGRLVRAVHAEGAKLGAQIFFDGAGRIFASDETVSIGPSDLSPWGGPSMRTMTIPELDVMANDFAAAAQRAVSVGADLIELHMGHAHLLGRFLSPHWNRREDQYGGSLDARLRYPVEVLRRVRQVIGAGIPVTARLCLSECIEGGIELPEAIEIGKRLRTAGLDAIHTSVGTGTSPWGLASIFPTSFSPEAPFAAWARRFRQETGSTVIFAGKVSSPETAHALLADGTADFISVGRAALADPDWPQRAAAGKAVVPCIGCNQGCVDSLVTRKEITCTVNPAVGFEGEFAQAKPLTGSRGFTVIGGGIAGIVCALGLAERGGRVALYESARALGGQYRFCEKVPGKEQYGNYLAYLLERLSRTNVDVRLGVSVDAAVSASTNAEAVYWAGGAVPRTWNAGGLSVPVLQGWECFDSDQLGGRKHIFVVGAGQVGCDAAIWLASHGHQVTLADSKDDPILAFASRRHDYAAALVEGHVTTLWGATGEGGSGNRIHLLTAQGKRELQVDAVVAATGRVSRPVPALGRVAISIGDAARVGTALDAIRQATFHAHFSDWPIGRVA